jgi:hypothetical protein
LIEVTCADTGHLGFKVLRQQMAVFLVKTFNLPF